jgi:hypothetical protein
MDFDYYRRRNAAFDKFSVVPMESARPASHLQVYRDGVPHRTIQASAPSLELSMAALVTLSLWRSWSFDRRGGE